MYCTVPMGLNEGIDGLMLLFLFKQDQTVVLVVLGFALQLERDMSAHKCQPYFDW